MSRGAVVNVVVSIEVVDVVSDVVDVVVNEVDVVSDVVDVVDKVVDVVSDVADVVVVVCVAVVVGEMNAHADALNVNRNSKKRSRILRCFMAFLTVFRV